MKFRAERDALVAALAPASRASGRGGAYPTLSGLRLEVATDQLRIAGTDLDLTIETSVMVSATEDGVTVVPAKLLVDIVKSLEPGAVTVALVDDALHVASGRAAFTLQCYTADDFPKLPSRDGDTVTVPVAEFTDGLRQVVPAAATDDTRPILAGVLLTSDGSGLRMVATDSYRLAKRELPTTTIVAKDQKVLVPARALSELQRLSVPDGDLTVRLGTNDVAFGIGGVLVTTRLIEGEFPNYAQLIPTSLPNRLVVGSRSLLDAVKRVRLLARDSTTPVRIALRASGMELSAASAETGNATEEVDAKYEGDEMVVGFNPAYLAAAVEAVGEDEVVVGLVDSLKPAVFGGSGDAYVHLLMPVRVL